MNAPVLRLYVLVIVLFGVLVAFTSRWTVFEAEALRDNQLNRRELLQEQKIRRGTIRSADGEVLARSVRAPGKTFTRRYPTDDLFAHAVGYAYTSIGRAGLEQSLNDVLTGRRTELLSALESVLGRADEGNDVRTTLDAKAQRAAADALRASGHKGAAVALDVAHGRRARDGVGPELRPQRPGRPAPGSGSSTPTRRTRRCSTGPPRTGTRRARR